MFSACSQKDLEKIAKAGDEVIMPAGSLIVDQGQTGREAFVVLEGSVMRSEEHTSELQSR